MAVKKSDPPGKKKLSQIALKTMSSSAKEGISEASQYSANKAIKKSDPPSKKKLSQMERLEAAMIKSGFYNPAAPPKYGAKIVKTERVMVPAEKPGGKMLMTKTTGKLPSSKILVTKTTGKRPSSKK